MDRKHQTVNSVDKLMPSATFFALSPPPPPPLQQREGKDKDAVYVAAVPLRATKGPPQLLMSAAYSLRFWELQHFMVIIKPTSSLSKAFVFDYQPQDPENVYVALAALSGRHVPGVVLKRTLRRVPKNRCWFIGFSHANGVELADKFNEEWPTDLIVGKHDCRHYTSEGSSSLSGPKVWAKNNTMLMLL